MDSGSWAGMTKEGIRRCDDTIRDCHASLAMTENSKSPSTSSLAITFFTSLYVRRICKIPACWQAGSLSQGYLILGEITKLTKKNNSSILYIR